MAREIDEVISAFLSQKRRARASENTWTDGETIYSYRMPIEKYDRATSYIRLLHPRHSPSVTTSRHLSAVSWRFDSERLPYERVDDLDAPICLTCDVHHKPGDAVACAYNRRVSEVSHFVAVAPVDGLVAVRAASRRILEVPALRPLLDAADIAILVGPRDCNELAASIDKIGTDMLWVPEWLAGILTAPLRPNQKRNVIKRALTDAEYMAAIGAASAVGADYVRKFVTQQSTGGKDRVSDPARSGAEL